MTEKPDSLTDSDYAALANLRYILRRFTDFSTSAAQQEGLPSQQHQALLAIRGYRGDAPITVGVLAERLLIAPHSHRSLSNGWSAPVMSHASPIRPTSVARRSA